MATKAKMVYKADKYTSRISYTKLPAVKKWHDHAEYFETWEAAHAYVVGCAEKELQNHMRAAERAFKRLQRALALKPVNQGETGK